MRVSAATKKRDLVNSSNGAREWQPQFSQGTNSEDGKLPSLYGPRVLKNRGFQCVKRRFPSSAALFIPRTARILWTACGCYKRERAWNAWHASLYKRRLHHPYAITGFTIPIQTQASPSLDKNRLQHPCMRTGFSIPVYKQASASPNLNCIKIGLSHRERGPCL